MRHAVPPMILQAKYVLLISKTGQVRVAWFAFVTDNPQPGMTSGPFVAKLVSENLNAERDGSTHCSFAYTAKASSCGDMEKIISSQLPQILKGIDEDKWELFEQA
ncbi:unnamed protein product [Polarella glacialis]|uniref:Uncharacterized protein n=1 Tax=Polarella glacialis TaxID=89957 RepID=A0A813L7H2_POLGL|nr:unnamed protein product [Polarella glacialis]